MTRGGLGLPRQNVQDYYRASGYAGSALDSAFDNDRNLFLTTVLTSLVDWVCALTSKEPLNDKGQP
jgi:hypothetical protein